MHHAISKSGASRSFLSVVVESCGDDDGGSGVDGGGDGGGS